jgi:Arc/MetJ family transcription regulator
MLLLTHGGGMRTTITLDDELMKTAQEYTGVMERTAVIQLALKTLVELEAGRRLALLEGTMPDFPDIPRRRSELPERQHNRKKAS